MLYILKIITKKFRKQLLDERSRFSEEIKNTNRCEKELISCRTQLDTVTKRKVNNKKYTFILQTFSSAYFYTFKGIYFNFVSIRLSS